MTTSTIAAAAAGGHGHGWGGVATTIRSHHIIS
jgi:hypothetical protein